MNLATVPKTELIKRARFTCKHRHNGLSHPQCFDEQFPPESIGFFDIEATSLNASFGFALTYCIKKFGGAVLKRTVTPKDITQHRYDRSLCEQFLDDLGDFSRVVTYYGSRYDIPFMRTRCLSHDLDFPPFGSVFHTDLYYQVRSKLKLHSNRLEAACTAFGIEAKGHKLTPMLWRDAGTGCDKALAHVLAHNEEDVVSLEGLWRKLNGCFIPTKASI